MEATYLRIKMHLQNQRHWAGHLGTEKQLPIATFAGIEYLPGVGRIFVGLVGSAHNYLPEGGIARSRLSGRTPSDAQGLYRIINPEISPATSWEVVA
jgi:hypothetical protein